MFASFLLLISYSLAQPAQVPEAQSLYHFVGNRTKGRAYDYYLYLPSGYAKSKDKYPIVLFLHGSMAKGDNASKDDMTGPMLEVSGKGRSFPFILVSPQCPVNETWDSNALVALLDGLNKTYRVDTHRQYVTGLGTGGSATFEIASKFPARFAAVAPIGGVLRDGENFIPAFVQTPIYAVHGDKDRADSFEEDEKLCKAIKFAGGEIEFVPIRDRGQDVWIETYGGTVLYEWLLAHKK